MKQHLFEQALVPHQARAPTPKFSKSGSSGSSNSNTNDTKKPKSKGLNMFHNIAVRVSKTGGKCIKRPPGKYFCLIPSSVTRFCLNFMFWAKIEGSSNFHTAAMTPCTCILVSAKNGKARLLKCC